MLLCIIELEMNILTNCLSLQMTGCGDEIMLLLCRAWEGASVCDRMEDGGCHDRDHDQSSILRHPSHPLTPTHTPSLYKWFCDMEYSCFSSSAEDLSFFFMELLLLDQIWPWNLQKRYPVKSLKVVCRSTFTIHHPKLQKFLIRLKIGRSSCQSVLKNVSIKKQWPLNNFVWINQYLIRIR